MENSKIEWTDHTFNPWWGCVKISEGCKFCYAEILDNRYHHENSHWGPGSTRKMQSESYWKQPLKWNEAAEKAGVQAKVFCASMADVFEDHKDVHESRMRLFNMIDKTPWLIWQLLTKRPENIREFTPVWHKLGFPDNVWIGTSVENQKAADERIPHLLEVPAKVRFLSCEPLLGPLEFSDVTRRSDAVRVLGQRSLTGIHWVIAGGESGPKARPMHPGWVRSLRDQCQAAGVPFFFKQWGEFGTKFHDTYGVPKFSMFHSFQQWVNQAGKWMSNPTCVDIAGNICHIGEGFMNARDNNLFPVAVMHKVGKHKAGAILEGKEYKEFPKVLTHDILLQRL